jgi:hypothetical protein
MKVYEILWLKNVPTLRNGMWSLCRFHLIRKKKRKFRSNISNSLENLWQTLSLFKDDRALASRNGNAPIHVATDEHHLLEWWFAGIIAPYEDAFYSIWTQLNNATGKYLWSFTHIGPAQIH